MLKLCTVYAGFFLLLLKKFNHEKAIFNSIALSVFSI